MIKKIDALKIVFKCADKYETSLKGRNLLFAYSDKKGKSMEFIETVFLDRNFMHLTGIAITNNRLNAVGFYKSCLKRRLSEKDIQLKGGTTELKLKVLPQLMDLPKCSRMLGDSCNSGCLLYTDTLIGSTRGCMGFVPDGVDSGFYVPNTVLKDDIRKRVLKARSILLVCSKDKRNHLYDSMEFCKDSLSAVKIPKEIEDRLDSSLLERF